TNISYRANLRYSFQDRAGKWVQPQTLAQEQVVYFDGQGTDAVPLPGGKLFGSVFNMAGLPWHKVYAVRTGAANLGPGLPRGADDERLVVMYGNFLNDTGVEAGDGQLVQPTTPDAAAFAARVAEASRNHDRVLRSRTSGSLPFWSAYVLDASLEDTVVVHRREFVLPDAYRPASPVAQFRADINQITGQVQAVVSGRPITDNYLADGEALDDAPATAPLLLAGSFVSDSIPADIATLIFAALGQAGIISGGKVVASKLPDLDLYAALGNLLDMGTVQPNQLSAVQAVLYAGAGAPVLFGAVADRARTLTVKNQPGWFVLDNGDEAFLLRPAPSTTPGAPPVFGTLEEGLVTSAPPFNPTSFILKDPAISAAQSRQIFSDLQSYSILDEHAVPNVALATPKFLDFALKNLGLTDAQLAAICDALLNYPIVFPGSFISPRVNAGLSTVIYTVLKDNGIIAHDGRVQMTVLTATNLTLVLGNLLNKGSIGQRDVVAIYRTLVESAVPLGLSWWNTGEVGAFTPAGPFVATRLTTAAVQRLERALFVGGIPKLLSLDMQNVPVVPILPFSRLTPAGGIRWPEAIDGAQVDFEGLYGRYFWELYYHAPMLVANSLAAAGQYREALSWFQFVFDPTVAEEFVEPLTFAEETHQLIDAALSASILTQLQATEIGVPPKPIVSPEGRVNPDFNPKISLAFLTNTSAEQQEMVSNVLMNYRLVSKAAFYWQFRPFRQRSLQTLTEELTDSAAIRMYNDEPFDPFAIARLRIGAFEKATVMQYIDTLLAWGDFYFAQDTWETLTAATLLYTYAGDLLGPRPQQVGVCSSGEPTDFKTIRETYAKTPGGIPQFLIYLETTLPPQPSVPGPDPVPLQAHAFNDLGAYFCVPENSLLVSYWDRVEDRLYKIRHSMNIQGQVRSLALFEPPLDPLALVRAGGASNSVLPAGGYTSPPVPAFRFSVMVERARA
ncbi:MAG: hypothetical protein ICV87_04450, partial [Gemmatimonadetes bacterium]|nr:hypothetical protein [Gemmatimonadota bacterium]